MKLFFVGLLLMGATATADESAYMEFNAPVIRELAEDEMSANDERDFQDCDQKNNVLSEDPINPIDAIDQVDVIVDKIINIGKKVWAIVELGRPVVNIKTDTANALPKGILCWSDLGGWAPTKSKAYQITYTNKLGYKVVDFAFRVIYTTGGNYKGRGQYITNTTIIPSLVDVAWGYKFNAISEVPTVYNSGTSENPVAGMHLNMKWSVETVMQTNIKTESFVIGGDGSFKRLD